MSRLLLATVGIAACALIAGCDPPGEAAMPDAPPLFDSANAEPSDPAPTEAAPAHEATADPDPVRRDPDRLLDQNFDDLKFDIEPDAPFARDLLTPSIEALDGQRIRIRGYILPTAQKRGIKQFVLVRDNQECCFGPGAALYDCILVSMKPGESTEFSIRPVSVTGRLSIEEFPGPEGAPLAIYQMQGESVD